METNIQAFLRAGKSQGPLRFDHFKHIGNLFNGQIGQ